MEQPTAAPAPIDDSTPPEPISAVDHALTEGDQSAYKAALRAEQAGTPLPAVPIKAKTPEPAKDAPLAPEPARELSKRQQEANDRTQRAIQQAHADLIAENARLRAQMAPPQEPAAPAPTPEAEYKRFRAMPDAPKLSDFEDIEDHAAAMALFIADKRYEERDAKAKEEIAFTEFTKGQQERTRAFQGRVKELEATKPDFWDSISPEVKALRPREDLRPGERPSAANDLAGEILDNEHGPQLMAHLTDHPDVLTRLTACTSRPQLYVELGKIYATLEAVPQTPPTKMISSAPKPPTTLGTKSAAPANEEESAVRANDQAAFKANRYRELAAQQR